MPPSAQCRWFRFRLRTLLMAMTIVCLIAAYPRMKVAERRWMARRLQSRGALVVTWSNNTGHNPPAILSAFGAEPVQWIELPTQGFSRYDINLIASAFPEADIQRPAGPPVERPLTFWVLFSGPKRARE